jgi:uncharacterized protein YkwD
MLTLHRRLRCMFRRIFSICISAAAVLFALALLWPAAAEQVTSRIMSGVTAVEAGRVTLIGKEQIIKVVDPATVTATIREEAPHVIALFRKRTSPNGQLALEDIIDGTNAERIKAGLQPLKVNVLLGSSAELKTDDMIDHSYFEHTSPTGVTVSDLGAEVGYDYLIMGENLALGNFTDADDLVQAWMASPGHRANILNPLYQEIGVYAAMGTYEDHEVWFAVQHFGAGRSACPAIDRSLKFRVDTINAELTNQQKTVEALKVEIEAADPNKEEEYEKMVEEFNTAIRAYNAKLEVSHGYIDQYNKQVRGFNSCLSKYQK